MAAGSRIGCGIGTALAAAILLGVAPGAGTAAKRDCGKTIVGTKRGDSLVGGNASERIRGFGGDDRMGGGKGADRLGGGPGKDRISGGKGRDRVRGGPSSDRIRTADRRLSGKRPRAAAVDEVDCGPGDDSAIVDADDHVRRCEDVQVRGSAGGFENPSFALPSWGDVMWSDELTYRTIQLADITGDGRAELLGRAFNGIEAHEFDAETGQWKPLYGAPDPVLSDAAGWDSPEYALTIHTGQLDGLGGEELIARGSAGVYAWRYLPTSTGGSSWFRPSTPAAGRTSARAGPLRSRT